MRCFKVTFAIHNRIPLFLDSNRNRKSPKKRAATNNSPEWPATDDGLYLRTPVAMLGFIDGVCSAKDWLDDGTTLPLINLVENIKAIRLH